MPFNAHLFTGHLLGKNSYSWLFDNDKHYSKWLKYKKNLKIQNLSVEKETLLTVPGIQIKNTFLNTRNAF